jgi:hypothetical protein
MTARVRVEFATDGQMVRQWVLTEDPLPSATARWELVQSLQLPLDVEIFGVALTASMEAATTTPSLICSQSGSVLREFYSNGTAEAMAVYLDRPVAGGQRDKYRVLVFPISAIPTLLDDW